MLKLKDVIRNCCVFTFVKSFLLTPLTPKLKQLSTSNKKHHLLIFMDLLFSKISKPSILSPEAKKPHITEVFRYMQIAIKTLEIVYKLSITSMSPYGFYNTKFSTLQNESSLKWL